MSSKLLNNIQKNVCNDLLLNIFFIHSQQYKITITHRIKHYKSIVDTINILRNNWSNIKKQRYKMRKRWYKVKCKSCNKNKIEYFNRNIKFYRWTLNCENKFIIKNNHPYKLCRYHSNLLSSQLHFCSPQRTNKSKCLKYL